jgi:hypothetical protein
MVVRFYSIAIVGFRRAVLFLDPAFRQEEKRIPSTESEAAEGKVFSSAFKFVLQI